MSEMQGEMIFRQKTTHQVRCDLCGRIRHESYRYKIGPYDARFCSLIHLEAAKKNYQYKIDHGISPVNLQPVEDAGTPEDEGDNMGVYE